MFEINIKSGTCGWFDEDGCDMGITKIESNSIPCVNDELLICKFNPETNYYVDEPYLVKTIKRTYVFLKDKNEMKEHITVYVVKI